MAYGSSPSVRASGASRAASAAWTWCGSTYGVAGLGRRVGRRAGPGPRPEDQQVRERVPAQPVGAVHAAGDLARGEQARDGRRARVRHDPDAAHHVVGGRADLHRPGRDVDVGELLELLVHRGQLAPHVLGGQVADVEEDAAMRRAAALLDLGVDRPRDVVPGRELGRPPRVGLAALRERGDPCRGLVVGRGVLGAAVLGEVFPHEPLAQAVAQDPALAADGLGDQQAADARRPDHPGGVELDELHVDELGTGLVGERLPVAAVLPRVRGDLVGLADPARGEHDRLGREDHRVAGRPPVADRPGDPAAARRQVRDRALHEDVDAGRDHLVLERADHLEPGPVADVGEPRVGVAAERPLEDPPVAGPVEDRAPALQLVDAGRGLLRVQLGHARVVEQLAADHRVAEVDLPGVVGGHVAERRRDAALGHHGVGLAEQRLADQPDRGPGGSRLDRGPQPGPARADDEDVVGVRLRVGDRHGRSAAPRSGSPGR